MSSINDNPDPKRDSTKRKKGGEDGQNKKQKANNTSLLERLREMKWMLPSDTEEGYQERMDLFVRHSSEFPSKLRPAIAAAKRASENMEDDSSRSPTEHFCALVHQAVMMFGFGSPIPADMDGGELDIELQPTAWHGIDSDVDTEDQLEVMLRLYPYVFGFRKNVMHGQQMVGWFSPVGLLASSAKAVSFMPLMLDLATEFDEIKSMDMFSQLSMLLNNCLAVIQFHEEPSEELDEASLAVFLRLREKGYVIDELLHLFLIKFIAETARSSRDFSFIEKRIRHIIEWEPSLVKHIPGNDKDYCLIDVFGEFEHLKTGKLDIRFYEFALEMGTLHYPQELLGFGFHKSNYEAACQAFGIDEVKASIKNKIAGALSKCDKNEKNKLLLSWIVKAATDESISLDGVYTLIRFDPSTVVNSRKTKEQS